MGDDVVVLTEPKPDAPERFRFTFGWCRRFLREGCDSCATTTLMQKSTALELDFVQYATR